MSSAGHAEPRAPEADDAIFRDEVRRFLDAELTDDLRDRRNLAGIYADVPIAREWHRKLARRGWSVPTWPVEWGGTGWSQARQLIFDRELAAAGAPPLSPNSTRMIGPTIIRYGTQTQKQTLLPRIRSGEDWWAQGYSEPQAGSDLASLKCRAVRDGDDYVINGTKIWTTHAQWSNKLFCLVRTQVADRPQKGISFLLLDMDTPGIDVHPIISMSGDHELNQIFFTNARAPATSLLGPENDGWTVAKYLLQHERLAILSPLLGARLAHLKPRIAALAPADAHDLWRKAADAAIALDALEASELRALAYPARDLPATAPAMLKIRATELRQRLAEIAIEVEGPVASATPAAASLRPDLKDGAIAMCTHLNDRAASIYAGSNEVQRNIIAKLLGL